MKLTPKRDFLVVIGLFCCVLVPSIIALLSIDIPRSPIPFVPNPSPYGYTWSLGLFIIPALTILLWLHHHKSFRSQRKAFYFTIIPLTLLGFSLDFIFGLSFFVFPNREATLVGGCQRGTGALFVFDPTPCLSKNLFFILRDSLLFF
jgi:hypothetical protein